MSRLFELIEAACRADEKRRAEEKITRAEARADPVPGEWRVCVWVDDVRRPDLDYYGLNEDDAFATARAMEGR